MPTDPNATQGSAPDPIEDTPADEPQDTAPDTQGSSVDWETRYKQLQSRASKAERERDLLRQQIEASSEEDDDDDFADDEEEPVPHQAPDRGAERLSNDSWQLAEQVYGEDALAAYIPAAKLLNRAVTPADHVAAFEAYHQARLEGAKPKPAVAAAQGEPPQPRIESNRPDESPDFTDIDRKAEAAKAKGDSRSWIQAQLERAGVR